MKKPLELLFDAIKNGDFNAASDILKKSPETAIKKNNGEFVLSYAIDENQIAIAEKIIKYNPCSVNQIVKEVTFGHLTAFANALSKKKLSIVKKMIPHIKYRILTSLPVNQKKELLHGIDYIALYGDFELIELIIKKYPKFENEYLLSEKVSNNLLIKCIIQENYELVINILHKYPKLFSMKYFNESYVWISLPYAFLKYVKKIDKQSEEKINTLLELIFKNSLNDDIEVPGYKEMTPLAWCLHSNQKYLAEKILLLSPESIDKFID